MHLKNARSFNVHPWYNRNVVNPRSSPRILPWIFLSLAACTGRSPPTPDLPTVTLIPHIYPTTAPTVQLTQPDLQLPTVDEPTPTPLTHIVQSNETLLGIASRYGVSLEDLLIANPGIDPRLLSIGQQLIIPGEGGDPAGAFLPTPTPVPMTFSPVRCHRTPSKDMWCLVDVESPQTEALEGITLLVTLIDSEGDPIDQTIGYSPLNLLRPNQRMPIAVFFQAPPDEALFAVATPISAVSVSTLDARYTDTTFTLISSEPSLDRLSWQVQGEIELNTEEPQQQANVHIVIVALDSKGEIIGFRKWEAETELAGDERRIFDVMVFSLGPPIERVDILTEAVLTP
jgi:LysM repeat protein